jgi:hypothetical protein
MAMCLPSTATALLLALCACGGGLALDPRGRALPDGLLGMMPGAFDALAVSPTEDRLVAGGADKVVSVCCGVRAALVAAGQAP